MIPLDGGLAGTSGAAAGAGAGGVVARRNPILRSGSGEPIDAGLAKMTTMPFRSTRSTRRARSGAGDALATLHREQYGSLVRLANLLLDDRGRSEEVVQDAFVKLQLRWGGLRRLDRAPAYLRSAVLNGARSALRHGKVVGRHAERRTVQPDVPTPEAGALMAAEHQRMVAALRLLPARQREALALRYYLDLGERDMAEAMGVSAGSVKTHLRRGLASLAELLGDQANGVAGVDRADGVDVVDRADGVDVVGRLDRTDDVAGSPDGGGTGARSPDDSSHSAEDER